MEQTEFFRKCLLLRLTALLLWAVGILWLSLTPHPPRSPVPLLSWDKLQHAGAYALLTWLAGRCLEQWRPLSRHAWRSALLLVLIFGGLIEILQGALTHARRAEWGDWAADGFGAILVVGIVLLGKRARRQKSV